MEQTKTSEKSSSGQQNDTVVYGVGTENEKTMHIEAKVGEPDGFERADIPIPTERELKRNKTEVIVSMALGVLLFVLGVIAAPLTEVIGVVFILCGFGSKTTYERKKKDIELANSDFAAYRALVEKRKVQAEETRKRQAAAAAAREAEKRRKASEPVRCPKCGSTSIATIARGYSLVWGIYGNGSPRNVCQKCGYRYKPSIRR